MAIGNCICDEHIEGGNSNIKAVTRMVSKTMTFEKLIIQFFLCCVAVNAFFPNNYFSCLSHNSMQEDNTHSSITEQAIAQAIEEILSEVSDSKGEWKVARQRALETILEGSYEIGQLKDGEAAYHFNAEQFVEGNDLLIRWRKQLLDIFHQGQSVHELKIARHLIGQMLHLIQDFYSNSDWSEFRADINHNLTLANREPLKLFQFPCLDKKPNKVIVGNIAHGTGYITSGFRSGQDVKKPNETGLIGTKLAGKCSHGGPFDNSSNMVARGGVNSESHNPELSPKNLFHSHSSNWATRATKELFYSASDYGLTSTLKPKDILRLLGVGSKRHIGFLQTDFLCSLSGTNEWLDGWASYRTAWPWSVSHLYTADGHFEGQGSGMYEELRDRPRDSSLPVTEANILSASEYLPDDSDLIIVTNGTLDGPWRAELLRKVFLERNIRVWWFVMTPKPAEKETLKLIDQFCSTTKGMMFYIRGSRDLVDIVHAMKSDQQLTHYVMRNEIHFFLPKDGATFLVTNCKRPQTGWPSARALSGESLVNEVITTGFTTIYKMTPIATKDLIGVVNLGDDYSISCTFSTWTSDPLARVQPVLKGPRDQWYPKNQVCSECRIAVKTTAKHVKVKIDERDLAMSNCQYKKMADETLRSSLSEKLTNVQAEPNKVMVTMEHSKKLLETYEYIDSQRVEVDAESIVLTDAISSQVKIRNLWSDEITVEIDTTSGGVDITPKSCSLPANGFCEVKIIFHSSLLNGDTRPITLYARSQNKISNEESYDIHTLHIITTNQDDLPTQSTSTSSPSPSSFTARLVTLERIANQTYNYNSSTEAGISVMVPFDKPSVLVITFAVTFLPLVTLLTLAAIFIRAYYYCRDKRPLYKKQPVTEL